MPGMTKWRFFRVDITIEDVVIGAVLALCVVELLVTVARWLGQAP
jgi:hypothetical protein